MIAAICVVLFSNVKGDRRATETRSHVRFQSGLRFLRRSYTAAKPIYGCNRGDDLAFHNMHLFFDAHYLVSFNLF
jgi:hypothetical protein